ncbi:hypothetical protein ACFP2T_42190 [Plantactinospora solaniradicis]|uniref:Uncharacterized protein n=1 Tax=Plantactinospora solaniradicis TaxID=1723736 RepID=A0ABW1KLQ2_9ACTN
MAGEVSRRLVGVVTLLVAAGSWLAIGGVASAKPTPKPTSVVITSKSMPDPLTLRADTNEDLFEAVLDQVDWLTGDGPTTAPKAADLGPKYTVVVHVGDAAKKSYDLYPLAKGGPRAFRPARQPDRSQPGAAWFFGRLTMAETLLAAGAPLPEQNITTLHGGGIGGGERVIPDDAISTGEDVDRLFGELRRLMLLNGAVLVSITLGLAGIALLVRRRTR